MTTMLMVVQCLVCLIVGWYGRILYVRFKDTVVVKAVSKKATAFLGWLKRVKREGVAMGSAQKG